MIFSFLERKRIKFHLIRTERWLKIKDTSSLNHDQKQNRLKALNLLNTYWKKEIFPKNITHQHKIPQIMDQSGTMCAVAFIMHNCGHQNLIRKIAQKDNYAYVDDIPDDHPLIRSLNEYGISKKEAARIQPAYVRCLPVSSDTYGATQLLEPIVALAISFAALAVAIAIPVYLNIAGPNFRLVPIAVLIGIIVAGTIGFALFFQYSSQDFFPDYKGTKGIHTIDRTHTVTYWIGGGKVTEITPSIPDQSLIINIEASKNGELTIALPRSLIDSRLGSYGQGEDDSFFVLVNGAEVDYDETATSKHRTLTIPFEPGMVAIEIIGISRCYN